jgi:hypothetical protein
MQWSEVIDNPYFKNLPFKQYGYETPYSHAPELCIEIVSPFSIKNFDLLRRVEQHSTLNRFYQ